MRGHKKISFHIYKTLDDNVNFSATEEMFEQDCTKSTLIFVNPMDYKLNFCRAYYNLAHLLKGEIQPGIVSFVGPTGAGKSLLMRLVMTVMNSCEPVLGLPTPEIEIMRNPRLLIFTPTLPVHLKKIKNIPCSFWTLKELTGH